LELKSSHERRGDFEFIMFVRALVGLCLLRTAALGAADFLRPALHITPFNNAWLNDPNGLFRDADGLWHAYYQCMLGHFETLGTFFANILEMTRMSMHLTGKTGVMP
jgi:hypothetical protein